MPNILVIKYSSFGDIINALPAVKFLRDNYHDSKIHWVVKKEYRDLISDYPFIDGIIEYEGNSPASIVRLVRRLRSLKIDIVVDMHGLLRSAIMGWLTGAGVRVCRPYTREWSSIFYTKIVGLDRAEAHAVKENMSIIEGLTGRKFSGLYEFNLNVNDNVIAKARSLIGNPQGKENPVIVISPTARWRSKMWEHGRFASLADMLIEELSAKVVFTGVKSDSAYIDSIRAMMENPSLNIAGQTDIKTLIGVVKLADMVISCDSGTMHLASALSTPVLAIFGPTDPSYTGPFNKKSIVVKTEADCSPCRKRACKDMRCLKEITPEMVFAAAVGFFKGL